MFGLAGTLTGALVTGLAQWALLKRQERQRHLDRQWSAVVEYLATAELLTAEADSLRYAIVDARLPDKQIEMVFDRYYDQWAAFQRSKASVALGAVKAVRDAGDPLWLAVQDLSDSADHIYMAWTKGSAVQMPRGEKTWGPRYRRATDAAADFAKAVRKAVGDPDRLDNHRTRRWVDPRSNADS